jgi:hypothetical protein
VRSIASSILAVALAAAAGCYDQPGIPAERPLTCTVSAKPEKDCPMGYACMASVCAARVCMSAADCPAGFTCGRTGCTLPPDGGARPAPGGGAEGGTLIATPPDAGGTD